MAFGWGAVLPERSEAGSWMLSSADWPGSGSSLSERKKTVFRSSSSWVTAGRGAR